jgi:hypothetical protein
LTSTVGLFEYRATDGVAETIPPQKIVLARVIATITERDAPFILPLHSRPFGKIAASVSPAGDPVTDCRVGPVILGQAPLAGADEIDPPAAALTADKPLMPVRDRHLSTIAFRHRGRVRLDLVPAIETPYDQPHPRRSGVAERHRRAAVTPILLAMVT